MLKNSPLWRALDLLAETHAGDERVLVQPRVQQPGDLRQRGKRFSHFHNPHHKDQNLLLYALLTKIISLKLPGQLAGHTSSSNKFRKR
jgi:hypothetical protein